MQFSFGKLRNIEMAGLTYDQIGRILGISIPRVIKIEANALRKLRRGLEKKGITVKDVRAMPMPPDDTFKIRQP